jgi:hypothetical protein
MSQQAVFVKHIMSEKSATAHEMTEFAVVKKRRGRTPLIVYPEVGK